MASRSWNKVELIGNLTKDPELRFTPNGAAVATFSIATNRTFVIDGEKKEEADFHRIVAWNKLAELCNQLLKKGNKVFVSGRLQNRQWEDAQSGQTRYMTEIVLEDMILLTSRGGEGGDYSADISGGDDGMPARQMEEMPKAETPKPAAKPNKTEDPKREKPVKEEVEDLDDLPF